MLSTELVSVFEHDLCDVEPCCWTEKAREEDCCVDILAAVDESVVVVADGGVIELVAAVWAERLDYQQLFLASSPFASGFLSQFFLSFASCVNFSM